MIASVDLSLRSTGIIALDDNKNLIDFKLVKSKPNEGKTKKERENGLPILNDEDLIIFNSSEIIWFINTVCAKNVLDAILIEGLSFNSKSGSKDILAGNAWLLRVELKRTFSKVPIHIIPVQSWRSKILNKQDRADAKAKYGKKWQKEGVVEKLPEEVKGKFVSYITKNKFDKTGLFDLADAFAMGVYYLDYVEGK